MTDTKEWGVVVDECGLFAIGRALDFWTETLVRMQGLGRVESLDAGLGGGMWHLTFGTKDDCEFAREYMSGKGLHPKCLKVSTLDVARKSVQRRHSKYPPGHSCSFCRTGAS